MKTKFSKKLGYLSLLLIVALTFISVMVSGNTVTSSAAELPAVDTMSVSVSESNTFEVASYVEVFQSYYDVVVEEAELTETTDICSFEEFCDKYYQAGMSISEYTNAVISANIYGQYTEFEEEVITRSSSSSGDANYILSSIDYSTTPASQFRRALDLGIFDFSSLLAGDIIYET